MLTRALLGFLAVLSLVYSGQTFSACSPQQVLRDDVLIVVNGNSTDSSMVGDYYCEQRGIAPGNIAHVFLPVSPSVQLEQFFSLRDQLIKFLQENTLTGSEPIAVCDTSLGYTRYYCPQSVDQIRRLTRIRYLVTTKGIPVQFEFTGSQLLGTPTTSVDNYLRFWLLNYYAADTPFSVSFRARAFEDGRGMRLVQPSIDHELIVGRIDGITAGSAMTLVDRAVAAERNGIFGKLYSSRFGPLSHFVNSEGAYWKSWSFNGPVQAVYPSWKYIHGLFGDLQGPGISGVYHATFPECVTYNLNGESPQNCVTRLTEGFYGISSNDPGPGAIGGRIPLPDNALVYQGYADGAFSAFTDFNSMLNWRQDASCNVLCAPTDTACRAASTDVYREIDTRCVGVAEGFIGYNHRSFSVGLMAGSPTGWYLDSSQAVHLWNSNGAVNTHYWHPEVREDTGFDDNYSLWFRKPDLLATANCYGSGDDLQAAPSGSCNSAQKVIINQRVTMQERTVDLANPQTITVRFKFRALDLNKNLYLVVRLFVHESVYQDASVTILENNQIHYLAQPAALLASPDTPADRTSWAGAVATFTLDPALHMHPKYLIDGVKIRIESNANFEGQLAIDTVSVDIDGVDIPIQNPSFDDGHRQLSGGDSAASYLGRLNGTAYWANLTHHEALGHSFDRHPYETLIYFLRGLPLGDAVWFAEFHNSGILYGDPLYSPIAVHLHYLTGAIPNEPKDTFDKQVPLALQGDTVNGTGSDVTTTYSVDYCSGKDFFVCDQNQSWLPVVNLQNLPGGMRNMPLGSWDAAQLVNGDYTLRLAVTSSNSTSQQTQTFNDYYPLTLLSTGSVDLSGGGGGSSVGGSGGGGCALSRAGDMNPTMPALLLMIMGLGWLRRARRSGNGTIKTACGQDVCAMVLASGQHTFSCDPGGFLSHRSPAKE